MLVLTENAVEAVRRALAECGETEAGLRIVVAAGGCSGLQYKLGLETEVQEGDEIHEFSGVKVFVDAESGPLLAGVEIDFVEEIGGSGFVFNNPDARQKCGCGKSFC